jgi:hypothetical protein
MQQHQHILDFMEHAPANQCWQWYQEHEECPCYISETNG